MMLLPSDVFLKDDCDLPEKAWVTKMKSKERKRQGILAMMTAVVISTALFPGVVRAEKQKETIPLIRQTVGTLYDFSSEEAVERYQTISTYDEEGRLTGRENLDKLSDPDSDLPAQKETYTYEVDEKENPCRIIADFITKEKTIRAEVQIENQYEGDKLTRAAVTDILIDGESHKEELEKIRDTKEEDYEVYDRFELPLDCLRYYRGYEDAVLQSGPSELCHENNGHKIISKVYHYGEIIETTTEYLEDGSITDMEKTINCRDEEEKSSSRTIVTDGQNYITGYGEAGKDENGEWSGMAWYQYSEERDSETGEIYQSGTIKGSEGESGAVNWPDGLYCYLDKNGAVVRSELRFDRTWDFFYYENNLRTAEERYIGGKLVFRKEYTYFP